MTVLVLSEATDPASNLVVERLQDRKVPVIQLDTGTFPPHMSLSARLGGAQTQWSTKFVHNGEMIDLAQVRSVYYWRPTEFQLPEGMSDADRVIARSEARRGVLGLLQSLDRVPWVNHPYRVAAAEYKPVQLQQAARAGLRIPATYIGNDPDSARAFAGSVGGAVVCKPFAGRALSENGKGSVTWTTRIDPDQIDRAQFAATAHLVQAWVPKTSEARVTVVGDQICPVLIHADSEAAHTDWRSDYGALRYERSDIPAQVRQAINTYMHAVGLTYGAFDFAITSDRSWWFLECNPAGRWEWIEEATGVSIAKALAEALTLAE
jgi:ATP-grasp ribosomal peptide maturase